LSEAILVVSIKVLDGIRTLSLLTCLFENVFYALRWVSKQFFDFNIPKCLVVALIISKFICFAQKSH
ncbi:MAG: hypothetical protein QXP36_10340, partial [Conexivisphaerales archaeon]